MGGTRTHTHFKRNTEYKTGSSLPDTILSPDILCQREIEKERHIERYKEGEWERERESSKILNECVKLYCITMSETRRMMTSPQNILRVCASHPNLIWLKWKCSFRVTFCVLYIQNNIYSNSDDTGAAAAVISMVNLLQTVCFACIFDVHIYTRLPATIQQRLLFWIVIKRPVQQSDKSTSTKGVRNK